MDCKLALVPTSHAASIPGRNQLSNRGKIPRALTHPLIFWNKCWAPPRPEDGFCDSGKPHKWQLSASQEKFERDTQPIGGGLWDSAEPSLVYCLGGNTSSPARQLGISFLNHPSSQAQAVILQMSHPMNPAFTRQTHGLICPAYPSPSCNIQNPEWALDQDGLGDVGLVAIGLPPWCSVFVGMTEGSFGPFLCTQKNTKNWRS